MTQELPSYFQQSTTPPAMRQPPRSTVLQPPPPTDPPEPIFKENDNPGYHFCNQCLDYLDSLDEETVIMLAMRCMRQLFIA